MPVLKRELYRTSNNGESWLLVFDTDTKELYVEHCKGVSEVRPERLHVNGFFQSRRVEMPARAALENILTDIFRPQ